MIDRVAPPDSVSQRAVTLIQLYAAAAWGALDPYPQLPPPLTRGAAVFQEQCVPCHGATGRGDGPKARRLQGPAPASLADRAAMSTMSPVDVYRKLTIGVAGTAMPQFEETLSPEDRWAVASYVATLRADDAMVREGEGLYAAQCASCHGATGGGDGPLAKSLSVRPPALADLAVLGRFTDQELTRLILQGWPGTPMPGFARTLDPGQVATLVAFLRVIPTAERLVADRSSGANLLMQSFVLLLREGFEAILIVAALMAFLAKAGAVERRRHVAQGAWAAVGASIVTAAVVELLFEITPGQREALEGVTMLLATAVLFYVSYWLLSKIEVAKWNAFVKGRMEEALSTGSGFALASVAFLAVYREGFETILFYKALLTSAGSAGGRAAGRRREGGRIPRWGGALY